MRLRGPLGSTWLVAELEFSYLARRRWFLFAGIGLGL
jgi:hypothetical protein